MPDLKSIQSGMEGAYVYAFKKNICTHMFAHENDSKRTRKKLVTLVATFRCSLLLLF